MDKDTISKIARFLGVSEESVAALSDEIQSAMLSAVNLNNTDTEENADSLYATLNDLWTKGMIEESLREISQHTGISLDTLINLGEDTKHSLVFEYSVDSTNIDRFYEIVQKSLAVSDIASVAELLGISAETLTALPIEKQEQMCGHYSMSYEHDGDNSALANELREMMNA